MRVRAVWVVTRMLGLVRGDRRNERVGVEGKTVRGYVVVQKRGMWYRGRAWAVMRMNADEI